jgi:hypothetical protein
LELYNIEEIWGKNVATHLILLLKFKSNSRIQKQYNLTSLFHLPLTSILRRGKSKSKSANFMVRMETCIPVPLQKTWHNPSIQILNNLRKRFLNSNRPSDSKLRNNVTLLLRQDTSKQPAAVTTPMYTKTSFKI